MSRCGSLTQARQKGNAREATHNLDGTRGPDSVSRGRGAGVGANRQPRASKRERRPNARGDRRLGDLGICKWRNQHIACSRCPEGRRFRDQRSDRYQPAAVLSPPRDRPVQRSVSILLDERKQHPIGVKRVGRAPELLSWCALCRSGRIWFLIHGPRQPDVGDASHLCERPSHLWSPRGKSFRQQCAPLYRHGVDWRLQFSRNLYASICVSDAGSNAER